MIQFDIKIINNLHKNILWENCLISSSSIFSPSLVFWISFRGWRLCHLDQSRRTSRRNHWTLWKRCHILRSQTSSRTYWRSFLLLCSDRYLPFRSCFSSQSTSGQNSTKTLKNTSNYARHKVAFTWWNSLPLNFYGNLRLPHIQ